MNPVYAAAFSEFPRFEKVFREKLNEGYKLVSFKFESNEQTGHETLEIIFMKDYERFFLTQSKGAYAGGFSNIVFGREGERGEVL